jgi:DNA-binding NarL/FixJ family response regulator
MPVRVLLVDDHQIVRAGLRLLLERDQEIEVVGETGDGRSALQLAEELRPDVLIMDITMPGMNGIEATRQVLASCPDVKVLALSMHSGK